MTTINPKKLENSSNEGNALHEDLQEVYDEAGQRGVFEDMQAWDEDVFDEVAEEFDLTLEIPTLAEDE